jgi:hypothetical protein
VQKKEKKGLVIKDIYLYFMKCRDKIYNYTPEEEYTHKPWKKDKLKNLNKINAHMVYILHDLFKYNTDEVKSYEEFMSKTQGKEITMRRFGWFEFKSMRISLYPDISKLEFQMKQALQDIIKKSLEVELIEGYMKGNKVQDNGEEENKNSDKCLKESQEKVIAERFESFLLEFDEIFQWNIYPVFSVLMIFN